MASCQQNLMLSLQLMQFQKMLNKLLTSLLRWQLKRQLSQNTCKEFNKHEFSRKPEEAVVTIFAKGIPADSVSVNFGEQIPSVTIDVPGEEAYVFQPRLFGKVIPAKCKYVVLSTKIEIRLAKVEPIHWTSLEFTKDTLVVRSSNVQLGVLLYPFI